MSQANELRSAILNRAVVVELLSALTAEAPLTAEELGSMQVDVRGVLEHWALDDSSGYNDWIEKSMDEAIVAEPERFLDALEGTTEMDDFRDQVVRDWIDENRP